MRRILAHKFWNLVADIIALVVAVSLVSACSTKASERSRATEEAAVYSALINEQLEVPFSYLMGDPVLIVNRTSYETIEDDYLYGGAPSLDKEAVEDFHTANEERYPFDLTLSVNKPYEYITLPSDANELMELNQKYPNAISITALSKIGFNKKFDQALVYMAYYCGTECGNANIYLLVRKGDVWKVESAVQVWVS